MVTLVQLLRHVELPQLILVLAGGVTSWCSLQVLWMNTVLRVMWPYYNAAVGQQVLEQAVPIINEQLKPVRRLMQDDLVARHLPTYHGSC